MVFLFSSFFSIILIMHCMTYYRIFPRIKNWNTVNLSTFISACYFWVPPKLSSVIISWEIWSRRSVYTRPPNTTSGNRTLWPGIIFFYFQNDERQDTTRRSITGKDSLTDYCVLIYQSIYTDIYYWAWTHFLLNRYCLLTVLFW